MSKKKGTRAVADEFRMISPDSISINEKSLILYGILGVKFVYKKNKANVEQKKLGLLDTYRLQKCTICGKSHMIKVLKRGKTITQPRGIMTNHPLRCMNEGMIEDPRPPVILQSGKERQFISPADGYYQWNPNSQRNNRQLLQSMHLPKNIFVPTDFRILFVSQAEGTILGDLLDGNDRGTDIYFSYPPVTGVDNLVRMTNSTRVVFGNSLVTNREETAMPFQPNSIRGRVLRRTNEAMFRRCCVPNVFILTVLVPPSHVGKVSVHMSHNGKNAFPLVDGYEYKALSQYSMKKTTSKIDPMDEDEGGEEKDYQLKLGDLLGGYAYGKKEEFGELDIGDESLDSDLLYSLDDFHPTETSDSKMFFPRDEEIKNIGPEVRDLFGRNLLFYAVSQNKLETTKKLVESGYRIDITDSFGLNPFQCAWYHGQSNITNYLCNEELKRVQVEVDYFKRHKRNERVEDAIYRKALLLHNLGRFRESINEYNHVGGYKDMYRWRAVAYLEIADYMNAFKDIHKLKNVKSLTDDEEITFKVIVEECTRNAYYMIQIWPDSLEEKKEVFAVIGKKFNLEYEEEIHNKLIEEEEKEWKEHQSLLKKNLKLFCTNCNIGKCISKDEPEPAPIDIINGRINHDCKGMTYQGQLKFSFVKGLSLRHQWFEMRVIDGISTEKSMTRPIRWYRDITQSGFCAGRFENGERFDSFSMGKRVCLLTNFGWSKKDRMMKCD